VKFTLLYPILFFIYKERASVLITEHANIRRVMNLYSTEGDVEEAKLKVIDSGILTAVMSLSPYVKK
jgi:hypothetical protein